MYKTRKCTCSRSFYFNHLKINLQQNIDAVHPLLLRLLSFFFLTFKPVNNNLQISDA